eukprot:tig00000737_g3814.t2
MQRHCEALKTAAVRKTLLRGELTELAPSPPKPESGARIWKMGKGKDLKAASAGDKKGEDKTTANVEPAPAVTVTNENDDQPEEEFEEWNDEIPRTRAPVILADMARSHGSRHERLDSCAEQSPRSHPDSPEQYSLKGAIEGLRPRRVLSLRNLSELDLAAESQSQPREGAHNNVSGGATPTDRVCALSAGGERHEEEKKKVRHASEAPVPGFFGWLYGRLFGNVAIAQHRVMRIKHSVESGASLVFVLPYESVLTTMLLHYVLLRYGALLGFNTKSFGWWWLFRWLSTPTGWLKDLGSSGAMQPRIIVMQRPITFVTRVAYGLQWLGKKVVDGIRALAGKPPLPRPSLSQRAKADDALVRLVKAQRGDAKSVGTIHLCPELVVWSQAPYRDRRLQTKGGRAIDWVYGTAEAPGFVRELFMWYRDRRSTVLLGGDPMDLQKLSSDSKFEGKDDVAIAREVRRTLEERFTEERKVITGPSIQDQSLLISAVMSSAKVQAAIDVTLAKTPGASRESIEREGRTTLMKMAAAYNFRVIRGLGFFLKYIFRHLFTAIEVDLPGLERVRNACRKHPVIFMPCHKSHMDYLLLSFVLREVDMPLPHIAAGENLNIPIVGWIFRSCGAFFIKRTGGGEVYSAMLGEYVTQLLASGFSLEFFVEGGRSRSGKLARPRTGMLNIVTNAVLDGRVPDAYIVPVFIGYDKVVELKSMSSELMGEKKKPESLGAVIKASRVLGLTFGRCCIQFARPLSIQQFVQGQMAKPSKSLSSGVPASPFLAQRPYDPFTKEEDRRSAVRAIAHRIVYDINQNSLAMPSSLVATVLLTHSARSISLAELAERIDWLAREVVARGGMLAPWGDMTAAQVAEKSVASLEGLVKKAPAERVLEPMLRARESRRLELAYYRNNIIHLFVADSIIATALAVHERRAVRQSSLLQEVKFVSLLLKFEFSYDPNGLGVNFSRTIAALQDRGYVALTPHHPVRPAPEHGSLAPPRPAPAAPAPAAPAPASAAPSTPTASASGAPGNPIPPFLLEPLGTGDSSALGPATSEDPDIAVTALGEEETGFLCRLLYPFLDSYWVAALSLLALTKRAPGESEGSVRGGTAAAAAAASGSPGGAGEGEGEGRPMPESVLLRKMQVVAETLYQEGEIRTSEAVSIETIKNALTLFEDLKVVVREVPAPGSPMALAAAAAAAKAAEKAKKKGGAAKKPARAAAPERLVKLTRPFLDDEHLLQRFIDAIGRFRRSSLAFRSASKIVEMSI